jgi:hypothetical protein
MSKDEIWVMKSLATTVAAYHPQLAQFLLCFKSLKGLSPSYFYYFFLRCRPGRQ